MDVEWAVGKLVPERGMGDVACARLLDRRAEVGLRGDAWLMQIQLRDYRIRNGQMDAWVVGWKSHIVPLRVDAGFEVIGAWVSAQDERFVWLIGYPGAEGFQAADDRYYASSQRRALQPDPAELIEEARQTMVDSVL